MLATFVLSACFLSFLYGYVSLAFNVFPYQILKQAFSAYREIVGARNSSFYSTNLVPDRIIPAQPSTAPGLTLMTLINESDAMNIRVVDLDGRAVYDRTIDWFEIWPDPVHLEQEEPSITEPDVTAFGAMPKSEPGTHIHGIALMDNGDFVFNFEHLGLVRLNICGKPVWRLPYRTHHSVFLDEDQTIWVSGQVNRYQVIDQQPNYEPPFIEYTAVQVSQDGKILREFSIPAILRQNDLGGLLHLANLANRRTDVSGDTLHLNDVETFPASMREGLFRRGDVMVSLRNINTVLVFDPGTGTVKYLNTGRYVRQHDPDFLDGETISVLDNNNLLPGGRDLKSRIVIEHPARGTHETYYDGDEQRGFFTSILGKHQWLPNGNLLVTESQRGRAFELNPERRIVWEFVNFVGDGMVGLMEEATRLDPKFDRAFFSSRAAAC